MSYLYITFSKIFSNRKIAFLFDGYHVEKQTKNFFKVARNLAALGCTLSTKGERESQPVGNSDKYKPIRKRRKQPCKNRLNICLARASHRQSDNLTNNRNKE